MTTAYEARFELGESVLLQATVTGVQFTAGKVHYTVTVGDQSFVVDSCDVLELTGKD
jgi:hypothetical protein